MKINEVKIIFGETDWELTKWLDDYFDERPLLKRPEKNDLGHYMVQVEILPVLKIMFNLIKEKGGAADVMGIN